jgi:hypothetical protein
MGLGGSGHYTGSGASIHPSKEKSPSQTPLKCEILSLINEMIF